jgi:uncharacterized delta-60 repeat protein
MTQLKRSITLKVLALFTLAALPLSASQGRGGGPPPPPPSLPPAPITVVNPTAGDCYSGPGCLDPSFGNLGKVQQDIGGDSQYMHVIAIQPDGKIVAAGARWVGTLGNFDQSWVIGRFLGDGAIDTTFGVNGLVSLNLIAGVSSETPVGVAMQTDGKIVVAGNASGGGSSYMTAIRLSNAGALDSTFGSAGKVMLSFATSSGSGGMILQPDGKIVIGLAENGNSYARVTRLLANGAVDTKFGSKGSRLVLDMIPSAMALQSAGRIVLAGQHSSAGDAMLAGLTPAGELDTSFGNRGTTVVSFSGQTDWFSDLSIASDDSIAAGGVAYFATNIRTMHLAIGRFTANGALASGFGSSGRVVLDVHGGWDSVRAINLRPDGRVEFVGWAGVSPTVTYPANVIVGRLTTTGALDSSFGFGGVTETDFGVHAQALAVAVGPDGLLTVAGHLYTVTTNGPSQWMLARYFR